MKSTRETTCIFVSVYNEYTATVRHGVKAVSTVTVTHTEGRQPVYSMRKDFSPPVPQNQSQRREENKGQVFVQFLIPQEGPGCQKPPGGLGTIPVYIHRRSAAVLSIPRSPSSGSLSSAGGLEPLFEAEHLGLPPAPG